MKTKELGLYTKRDDYYVTVTVRKTGQIYNHLEDCYYDLDEERCFVIEGTVGEKWPVNLEALEKTYQLDEKTKKNCLMAFQLRSIRRRRQQYFCALKLWKKPELRRHMAMN